MENQMDEKGKETKLVWAVEPFSTTVVFDDR